MSSNPEIQLLVLKLTRALHQYGTPAHRLEEALGWVMDRFGVEAQFFSTPTAVFASMDNQPLLIRAQPGDIHLGKMVDLDLTIERLGRGEISAAEGIQEVDAIINQPQDHGKALPLVVWAVVSGLAARFFGGGPNEMLAAGLIGLSIGVLSLLAGNFPVLQRVFIPCSAFAASIIAMIWNQTISPTSEYIATLAGLIALIPGLTLTVALNELATQNLASGTARFSGAMVVFAALGFGVAMGQKVGGAFFETSPIVSPQELPDWTLWPALILAPIGIAVLLNAKWRDAVWAVPAAMLAYWGAVAGAGVMGSELGVFIAALCVGMFSNLYGRLKNRPASVPLIPGIMLLVPGSIGFSSVSALMDHQVTTAVDTMVSVALVGISLVAGLLVANVLLPSRRSL